MSIWDYLIEIDDFDKDILVARLIIQNSGKPLFLRIRGADNSVTINF